MVGTGFEGDVDSGAAGSGAGHAQRHDFGVGVAGALGVADAELVAICCDDDATDAGVGVAKADRLYGLSDASLQCTVSRGAFQVHGPVKVVGQVVVVAWPVRQSWCCTRLYETVWLDGPLNTLYVPAAQVPAVT